MRGTKNVENVRKRNRRRNVLRCGQNCKENKKIGNKGKNEKSENSKKISLEREPQYHLEKRKLGVSGKIEKSKIYKGKFGRRRLTTRRARTDGDMGCIRLKSILKGKREASGRKGKKKVRIDLTKNVCFMEVRL